MDKNNFISEYRLLSEALNGFAKQYPYHADQLGLRNLSAKDPSVERLLEGCAYLGAYIRQQSNQSFSMISEVLLQQLLPGFLNPMAPMTILQCIPPPESMYQTKIIEKNVAVITAPIGPSGKECSLTLEQALAVNPVNIVKAQLITNEQRERTLELAFSCFRGVTFDELTISRLPIYIDADFSTTCKIYFLLTYCVNAIYVSYGGKHHYFGGQDKFSSSHYFNCQNNAAFDRIKQFFAFPQSYFFIDLIGINELPLKEVSQLNLHIQLNNLAPNIDQLNSSMFCLNCTLAKNQYLYAVEPFLLDHSREEYPLIIDNCHNQPKQLINIESVNGVEFNRAAVTNYFPLCQYVREKAVQYYQITTYYDKLGNVRHYFSFSDVNSSNPATISCLVKVSDGDCLANHFQRTAPCRLKKNCTESFVFKNLTKPTGHINPPQDKFASWEFLNFLTCQLGPLCDIEQLKKLLYLCDWQKRSINQEKIEAILSVTSKMDYCLEKGVNYPLVIVELKINEKPFSSIAELYLFSERLLILFQQTIPINFQLSFSVMSEPRLYCFKWRDLSGNKAAI